MDHKGWIVLPLVWDICDRQKWWMPLALARICSEKCRKWITVLKNFLKILETFPKQIVGNLRTIFSIVWQSCPILFHPVHSNPTFLNTEKGGWPFLIKFFRVQFLKYVVRGDLPKVISGYVRVNHLRSNVTINSILIVAPTISEPHTFAILGPHLTVIRFSSLPSGSLRYVIKQHIFCKL